jgi:hypothetical protein
MKRRTFDQIVTFVGFGLSVFLFIAAGLLNWGATFADGAVKSQLEAQQIVFPTSNGDPEVDAATEEFFAANGEKIMTTGKQAQMYADYYIGYHLSKMPTYAEATALNRSAAGLAAASPANADLQIAAGKAAATVETVFKGESLRGTLLTAYAFWELGQIALISAGVALVGGILMLLLSIAGLIHLRRTPMDATI